MRITKARTFLNSTVWDAKQMLDNNQSSAIVFKYLERKLRELEKKEDCHYEKVDWD